MPSRLRGETLRFRMQLGTGTASVFVRKSDSAAPMDQHLFDKWLAAAERRP